VARVLNQTAVAGYRASRLPTSGKGVLPKPPCFPPAQKLMENVHFEADYVPNVYRIGTFSALFHTL